MGKDEGEYEETKIRVYKKVKHKDEGTMQKYFVGPISKVFSGSKAKKDRLTA
jgi:hypothetical protein